MAQEEGKTLSDVIRDYIGQHPEEKTRQIIAGLKAQGVDVSVDLVNKVKYRLKQAAGGSAVKKARRAKMKVQRAVAAPAQGGVTGTQLILDYMKQNRRAKPKEIQAGLAAQGHKVTMSLISAVRARRKARRKAKRMAASAAARTISAPSASLSAAQLVDVKRLADALGGADAVRSALDTLEELR